jgi:hypothetical protein
MCAATNRLNPRTLRIGAISTPYKPFRNPNSEAVAIPLIALPPAPITPITANCEAPEKVKRESKQLCKTLNPFATAAAPNATPYAPTVKETLRESRNVGEETLDTPVFCRIYPTAQSS